MSAGACAGPMQMCWRPYFEGDMLQTSEILVGLPAKQTILLALQQHEAASADIILWATN